MRILSSDGGTRETFVFRCARCAIEVPTQLLAFSEDDVPRDLRISCQQCQEVVALFNPCSEPTAPIEGVRVVYWPPAVSLPPADPPAPDVTT